MQRRITRHHAAKVVVQDGQDVVGDSGVAGRWQWAGPFEFLACICPQRVVWIHVTSVLLRGQHPTCGVVEAVCQVGCYLGAQRVGFCIGFEAVEGFGEVE